MTPRTASLLKDAHSHIVFPSSDEEKIDEAVSFFADAGIQNGEAVILVCRNGRRELIEGRFRAAGRDVEALQLTGQLAFFQADELLAEFLVSGSPDRELFRDAIASLIEKAETNSHTGEHRKVRIFGEMVSLLYIKNNAPAAERLEDFWNELIESHQVALFCAYSLRAGDILPKPLMDAHSHHVN